MRTASLLKTKNTAATLQQHYYERTANENSNTTQNKNNTAATLQQQYYEKTSFKKTYC